MGGLLFGAIGPRLPRRTTYITSFILVGLPFWVLTMTPPFLIALTALFFTGVAAGPINPLLMTVFQERTPPELRGRVGGITSAKRVADYAAARGVSYVNHTFTSHLALSASLQPYAGMQADWLCEYPTELKALAGELTLEHLIPNANGEICAPARPGLGMSVNDEALQRYRVDVRIEVNGRTLYQTQSSGMGD